MPDGGDDAGLEDAEEYPDDVESTLSPLWKRIFARNTSWVDSVGLNKTSFTSGEEGFQNDTLGGVSWEVDIFAGVTDDPWGNDEWGNETDPSQPCGGGLKGLVAVNDSSVDLDEFQDEGETGSQQVQCGVGVVRCCKYYGNL